MKYLVGLFCAAMTLLGASSAIDVAVASDANYRATPYRGEFSDWVPGQRGGRRDHDWDDWGEGRGRHHRRDRDDDRVAGVCSPRDESCCFNHSRRGPESITLTSGQSICGALRKLTPGGTIFLTPGSYTGGFTIYSPVTIQGPATSRHEEYYEPQLSSSSGRYRPKPVITGSGNCMMIDDRVTGSVYVSGVDFRLTGGGASESGRKKPACLVVNGGAFTLQSSSVTVQPTRGVPTAGILLHGGNVHIERSRVEGARYGIFVGESWRGGSFYIVESTISRNSTGIRVQGMVDVNVFGNTIENNGQRGGDGDGIVIDGGGGTFISNSIYGNNGNGIVLNEDVQNPRFLTNDISDNQRAGIYAPFGGDARFESNTVTYNRGEGFRCAQEPCPTFGSDNILEGNAGDCKSSFFKSCDRKKHRDRDYRRGRDRDHDRDRDRDDNRYESRKRDRDRNGYFARREKPEREKTATVVSD